MPPELRHAGVVPAGKTSRWVAHALPNVFDALDAGDVELRLIGGRSSFRWKNFKPSKRARRAADKSRETDSLPPQWAVLISALSAIYVLREEANVVIERGTPFTRTTDLRAAILDLKNRAQHAPHLEVEHEHLSYLLDRLVPDIGFVAKLEESSQRAIEKVLDAMQPDPDTQEFASQAADRIPLGKPRAMADFKLGRGSEKACMGFTRGEGGRARARAELLAAGTFPEDDPTMGHRIRCDGSCGDPSLHSPAILKTLFTDRDVKPRVVTLHREEDLIQHEYASRVLNAVLSTERDPWKVDVRGGVNERAAAIVERLGRHRYEPQDQLLGYDATKSTDSIHQAFAKRLGARVHEAYCDAFPFASEEHLRKARCVLLLGESFSLYEPGKRGFDAHREAAPAIQRVPKTWCDDDAYVIGCGTQLIASPPGEGKSTAFPCKLALVRSCRVRVCVPTLQQAISLSEYCDNRYGVPAYCNTAHLVTVPASPPNAYVVFTTPGSLAGSMRSPHFGNSEVLILDEAHAMARDSETTQIVSARLRARKLPHVLCSASLGPELANSLGVLEVFNTLGPGWRDGDVKPPPNLNKIRCSYEKDDFVRRVVEATLAAAKAPQYAAVADQLVTLVGLKDPARCTSLAKAFEKAVASEPCLRGTKVMTYNGSMSASERLDVLRSEDRKIVCCTVVAFTGITWGHCAVVATDGVIKQQFVCAQRGSEALAEVCMPDDVALQLGGRAARTAAIRGVTSRLAVFIRADDPATVTPFTEGATAPLELAGEPEGSREKLFHLLRPAPTELCYNAIEKIARAPCKWDRKAAYARLGLIAPTPAVGLGEPEEWWNLCAAHALRLTPAETVARLAFARMSNGADIAKSDLVLDNMDVSADIARDLLTRRGIRTLDGTPLTCEDVEAIGIREATQIEASHRQYLCQLHPPSGRIDGDGTALVGGMPVALDKKTQRTGLPPGSIVWGRAGVGGFRVWGNTGVKLREIGANETIDGPRLPALALAGLALCFSAADARDAGRLELVRFAPTAIEGAGPTYDPVSRRLERVGLSQPYPAPSSNRPGGLRILARRGVLMALPSTPFVLSCASESASRFARSQSEDVRLTGGSSGDDQIALGNSLGIQAFLSGLKQTGLRQGPDTKVVAVDDALREVGGSFVVWCQIAVTVHANKRDFPEVVASIGCAGLTAVRRRYVRTLMLT